MTAAAILKNLNRDISATVSPTGTTFGTMTHIGLPNQILVEILNFSKSKMADGHHLEKSKNVVLMDIIISLLKAGNKTANINV